MNDIEKKFFETFDIPKSRKLWTVEEGFKKYYPEITDRILLELYVIYSYLPSIILQVGFDDVEDLKKHLLSTFISDGKAFKKEVQALFKETECEYEKKSNK